MVTNTKAVGDAGYYPVYMRTAYATHGQKPIRLAIQGLLARLFRSRGSVAIASSNSSPAKTQYSSPLLLTCCEASLASFVMNALSPVFARAPWVRLKSAFSA